MDAPADEPDDVEFVVAKVVNSDFVAAAEDKSRVVGLVVTLIVDSGVVDAPADEPGDVEFVETKVVNSDVVEAAEHKSRVV